VSDIEDDGLIGIGVKANLARLFKTDQGGFVEELAATLERSLPDETQVERRGGLFAEKRITAVRIHLGDYLYSLEVPNRGGVTAARTKVVRGIKLKTEPMSVEDWLSAVSEALGRFAETNQQARDALWNLVDRPQEDAQ
jgi:hypothetical protein